jgi:hypothetical protein
MPYIDFLLLGYDALWTCREVSEFRRNLLPLSLGLNFKYHVLCGWLVRGLRQMLFPELNPFCYVHNIIKDIQASVCPTFTYALSVRLCHVFQILGHLSDAVQNCYRKLLLTSQASGFTL